MIRNEPMTIKGRGRLYTTRRHRRELETLETPYGRGTPVRVSITMVDRLPAWGIYTSTALFESELSYYGEVYVPVRVMDRLGLAIGDDVRVGMRSLAPQSEATRVTREIDGKVEVGSVTSD